MGAGFVRRSKQIEGANVQISKQTYQQLVELAKASGLFMQAVLECAVEAYRRQSFLEALNADFAALRQNPQEWEAEMQERKLWEQTLADDLKAT